MTTGHSGPIDVTVAGLIEHSNRILIVRERAASRVVVNLPGGHIEAGESPERAVMREVHEETGYRFEPTHLLGCYLWERPSDGLRFLRIVYTGVCPTAAAEPDAVNDASIVAHDWLTVDDVMACQAIHRYPIVERSIADYTSGVRSSRRSLTPFLPLPHNIDAVTARASILS
ncbi:MAG: NUDIX domain-containing protein [Pseudomonadota bacterium]